MERTFAIIKPDAVAKKLAGQILARIEAAGFTVVAMRLQHLTKAEAEGFYAVHQARPFFGALTDFMSSGPCVLLPRAPTPSSSGVLMGARTGRPIGTRGGLRRLDRNATHGSDAGTARSNSESSSGASSSASVTSDPWPSRRIAGSRRWRSTRDDRPFVESQVRAGVISPPVVGGYDRVTDEFKIFTNINNTVIDPKTSIRDFVDWADVCIVPPDSPRSRGRSISAFRASCHLPGKSTYARCGII
jgi:nucleoside-diphosphate kinase